MHAKPGHITEKLAIQTRLRRVEDQVWGLQRLEHENEHPAGVSFRKADR